MQVRLSDRAEGDEDTVTFTVCVQGEGVRIRVEGVAADEDLVTFVEQLAADFRGWAGERRWFAGDMQVAATFHSGGNVCLVWYLCSWQRPEVWTATAQVWVEAGEQMKGFAADIRAFVGPVGSGV
jgi:hypothetical protein